jgi:hypothetical protein
MNGIKLLVCGVFLLVFLSIDMNSRGGAGGSPVMGGGAGVAGSSKGVAQVHDTPCQDFFCFSGKPFSPDSFIRD